MDDEIYLKYVGSSFYIGIPARDITRAEFEAMSKEQQDLLLASSHYQIVAKPQPKKRAAKDSEE